MIGEQSKALYLRGFGFLHWMAGLDQGNTDYYYFVRSVLSVILKCICTHETLITGRCHKEVLPQNNFETVRKVFKRPKY